MRFSVIMPSTLLPYPGAAKNRETKILRSINSILTQTFKDFELIIVSDGCDKTCEIVKENYTDTRISIYKISKCETWSGRPRNVGIQKSIGEIITYLDIDDYWDNNFLAIINEHFGDNDWVFFDDIVYNSLKRQWYLRNSVLAKSQCGTSNVAHKRSLPVSWLNNTYAHDYQFVLELMKNKNYSKIKCPGYYVCHVPANTYGKGYDV